MKKILFILFAYFCLPSFGGIEGGCQPNKDKNRDKIWLFGKYSAQHSTDNRYGNTILNFNTNPPTYYYQYMVSNFAGSSASLSDTLGNLLCYTNGFHIGNTNGQKMRYGDSLDLNGIYHYAMTNTIFYPAIQNGICLLPMPNKVNSAVVLYQHILTPSSGLVVMGLNAAFIDFDRENGLGMVVQKDVPIFREICQGSLTVCRHANGRDWWIIKTGYGLGSYYRLLLSPTGIDSIGAQTMQALPAIDANKSGYNCFSPNGSKFAHYDGGIGTWLYDFDRCTGLLSNRQLLERRSNYIGDIYCGVAFSPNSRYMYVTQDTAVYQYDMQANNIENSKQTVAVWDGFIFEFSASDFAFPQLAPDGKIYINGAGDRRHLHIIHNPNEGGTACNIEQHAIILPTYYYFTMPNFPYFRLGSEPGTVCDSLGIETGVTDTLATHAQNTIKLDFQLSVSPNPTSGECVVSIANTIHTPLLSKGKLSIYAIDGRLLETFSNPFLNQTNFTINLKNYAKGVYIVEYEGSDGSHARARILRQ